MSRPTPTILPALGRGLPVLRLHGRRSAEPARRPSSIPSDGVREPLLKTIALVVSVAAFLALRAFVKFLLLPFRALRNLRKDSPIST
ncbi:hypothetical protein AFCDBAGC_2368 [Methylobacterium cerastii]|uniref:Uncharacterized protein n=1 Tax=Methylobacterium cerastii TaxID=932741 RepID=A0ABQ4QHL1_9HYPH|nr:hypothetical protein AFCDBAGC_2368 [Methylobacterium cerastii]